MQRGERGEGRDKREKSLVAVPCVTRETFQILCQPHQSLLFVREVRWKETLHLEFLLQDLRTNGDEDGAW